MQKYGLGKGLSSLIPKKIAKEILPKDSPVAEGMNEVVLQVEVEKVLPNPHQPRKQFSHSDLEDLANSIKEHGIIQPLIARPVGEKYELIVGERRLRAAKMVGLKTVPIIARQAEKQQQMVISLLENIQRSNLNPIEEAVAYQRLLNEFNLSQDELARRIGKSRPVVTNTLRLLTLPEPIQKAVIDGKISYSSARAIAGLPHYEQMKFFIRAMKANSNTTQISEEVKKISVRTRRPPDPRLESLAEYLRGKLATRVEIKKSGTGGQIIIRYYSDDELNEIAKKFGFLSTS